MQRTAEIKALTDYSDEEIAKYFVLLYAAWTYAPDQSPDQLRWRERFQAYQDILHRNAQVAPGRLTDKWLDHGKHLNRIFNEFFDADFDHPNAGAARAEAIALIGEIRRKISA